MAGKEQPHGRRSRRAKAKTQLNPLDDVVFPIAVGKLVERDVDLAQVVANYGTPPLWVREPGFATLVYIILEQQVSLASAKAAFYRLKVAVRPFTPSRFLNLTD